MRDHSECSDELSVAHVRLPEDVVAACVSAVFVVPAALAARATDHRSSGNSAHCDGRSSSQSMTTPKGYRS